MTTLNELVRTLDRDNFVILDTETTGLKAGEVCQIAIANKHGNVIFDTLVKTQMPIPKDATNIHGITNEMVANSPTWIQVNAALRPIVYGCDVIVYNADYDYRMIEQTCERWGIPGDSRNHRIPLFFCAMEAYAEFNGAWSEYHHSYTFVSLKNAYQRLIKNPKDEFKPHTAFGDVMMTYDLCLELQRIQHAQRQ